MVTGPDDVVIAPVVKSDLPAISKLHETVFGPGRFARTAYRVREGRPLISPFCRSAKLAGVLVSTITFTEVYVGAARDALLLGPLAVSPFYANIGIGRKLIATGLAAAEANGIRLVFLIGDLSYYSRFGFVQVPPGQIRLPGPADPARILACELQKAALGDYYGLIRSQ